MSCLFVYYFFVVCVLIVPLFLAVFNPLHNTTLINAFPSLETDINDDWEIIDAVNEEIKP